MKPLRLVLLALAVSPLQSCLVVPHRTSQHVGVSARVVDGSTSEPVPGAEIEFDGYPQTRTTSDESGRFRMRRACSMTARAA